MKEPNLQKYLRAVRRRLSLPRAVRARVMTDFETSIRGRMEAGEALEAILTELGSPKAAAAELNRQMQEFTFRKSPWRWVCLAASAVSLLILRFLPVRWIYKLIGLASYPRVEGVIGGADVPTAIFVSTTIPASPWVAVPYLIVFAAGIVGFFLLRRLKRK